MKTHILGIFLLIFTVGSLANNDNEFVVDIPTDVIQWKYKDAYKDPIKLVHTASPAVYVERPKSKDIQTRNMALFFQPASPKWKNMGYELMFTMALPIYSNVSAPIIKIKRTIFTSTDTPDTRTVNGFAQCHRNYGSCVSIRSSQSHYVIPENFDNMWVITVPLDESDINQLLYRDSLYISGKGSGGGQRFNFTIKVPLEGIETPLVDLITRS